MDKQTRATDAPGSRLAARLRLLSAYWSTFRWGVALVWKAQPRMLLRWVGLLIVQALLAPLTIVATREAVNAFSTGFRSDHATAIFSAALPIAILGVLLFSAQALASIGNYIRISTADFLRDYVVMRIQEKASELSLAFFESPDSYDLLHRARIDAVTIPAQLMEHAGALLQNGLALILIAALLTTYALWLPVLLIASALPGLWVVARHTLAVHHWRLENTVNDRRARHYDTLLSQREPAAELRLFELSAYFRDAYARLRRTLRTSRMRVERAKWRAELWATAGGWLGVVGGMVWILNQATLGLVRVADVVMCYQSFQQAQRLMRTLLDGTGGVYRSILFLENLRAFLELEEIPRTGSIDLKPQLDQQVPISPAAGQRESDVDPERNIDFFRPDQRQWSRAREMEQHVQFVNVSFRYPDSKQQALRNVSLELVPGRMVAVMGDNGAGKSTLIKLLCRFYEPLSGVIRINGIDIRELPIDELRRRITVLFQEPLRHHSSALDNIALGNLRNAPTFDQVEAAAVGAGADAPIRRLPMGYATSLSKMFGGVELSSGEWQRIALARAYLRSAPIVILDEPTSAMDPWAETLWLERFGQLVQRRTTLVITHRATTAMKAHYTYLMRDGEVVEAGTHAELIAQCGAYFDCWRQQTGKSFAPAAHTG